MIPIVHQVVEHQSVDDAVPEPLSRIQDRVFIRFEFGSVLRRLGYALVAHAETSTCDHTSD